MPLMPSVAVALMLLQSPIAATSDPPLDWKAVTVFVAGQVADTVTTCQGLQRIGGREANGLLPSSCEGIAAVKGALVTALIVAGYHAIKHGGESGKGWTVAYYVMGAIGLAVAAHNVKVLRGR